MRALRLRALRDAPADFDTPEREAEAWRAADWSAWISRGATFFTTTGPSAEAGGGTSARGTPGGLAAGVPDAHEPDVAWLEAVWVDPAARGTGLADRLVSSVLSWAAREGYRRMKLHVLERNVRAAGFYRRLGFRETGCEITNARGDNELEMQRPLGRNETEVRDESGVG